MIWVYSWVEGDSTLLIVLMRKPEATTMANGNENLSSIWEEFIKKVLKMTHSSIDIGPLQ